MGALLEDGCKDGLAHAAGWRHGIVRTMPAILNENHYQVKPVFNHYSVCRETASVAAGSKIMLGAKEVCYQLVGEMRYVAASHRCGGLIAHQCVRIAARRDGLWKNAENGTAHRA